MEWYALLSGLFSKKSLEDLSGYPVKAKSPAPALGRWAAKPSNLTLDTNFCPIFYVVHLGRIPFNLFISSLVSLGISRSTSWGSYIRMSFSKYGLLSSLAAIMTLIMR
jgi:hypothetical protein